MSRVVRAVHVPRPEERPWVQTCEEPGCERRGVHGKPYCPDHVERMPQIQRLRALLERPEIAQEVFSW